MRVFLVGGSDKHKEELSAYEEQFGFTIVGHVRYRTKNPHVPKRGTFDKVASMVVYQSHQLSKFASDTAKKSGVPLVILAFGAKMNAMKIAGIEEPVVRPEMIANIEMSQAEALKYLSFPYHKSLTVLRSYLVKSRQDGNKVLYDKQSLDYAVRCLSENQSLFKSLPEPYPRKKPPRVNNVISTASASAQPANDVSTYTSKNTTQTAPMTSTPVVAPDTTKDDAAQIKYMLLRQLPDSSSFEVVKSFDSALLNGSSDVNDLAASIEISADVNELPNKTVLLLVQPVLKTEVNRQVSLRQLPV